MWHWACIGLLSVMTLGFIMATVLVVEMVRHSIETDEEIRRRYDEIFELERWRVK